MPTKSSKVPTIKILSSNVRGFRTNIGELTHNFVLKEKIDIVFVSETFLGESIPHNFGTIPGYSRWHRRDRNEDGGGIALCFKKGTRVQILDEDIPLNLELIIFRYFDAGGNATLGIGCYRPPSQGTYIFNFIRENLDSLIQKWKTKNVIIIGDLNPRSVQGCFNEFLHSLNLTNHVKFPTHIAGSMLDPVISDITPSNISCSSLGKVGTSDHFGVLAEIKFHKPRPESFTRMLWKWDRADWAGLKYHLSNKDWEFELQGTIDDQVSKLNEIISTAQAEYVPSTTHVQRTSDLPWFGPRCRIAASAKYRAWKRLKAHPSERNKQLHREAARDMEETQTWAMEQWREDTKQKVREGSIGSKKLWTLIKDKQGLSHDTEIPPISLQDGQHLLSSSLKAEKFAEFFSNKMQVDEPDRPPPNVPRITNAHIDWIEITPSKVYQQLRSLDPQKATGPDNIGPRLLKECSKELAFPLHLIFKRCLEEGQWPSQWKCSNVIPVHKKGTRTLLKNYRPVSLLPVMSKVFEHLIHKHLIIATNTKS